MGSMDSKDKTVAVIGTGYVGVTTAAILANAGYTVYALDISEARLDSLRQGKSFFYEEGLNPLISNAIKTKKLLPTASYEEAISNSNFVFSCVGTPDNPDGSSNLSFVFSAAKEAAKYISPGSVYIQKSTVPVGTGQKVAETFKDRNVVYVSNPEFLREGTGLSDSLFFDRIVVGGENKEAVDKVIGLYKNSEKYNREIAKMAGIGEKKYAGDYIATGLNSAELIKVTANAFLALKISFANSIAKLADASEANISEVMDAVGADRRIGRAFLNAGRGYGGGCFPKDVSGLISSANEHGVDMPIMVAATEVNESMPEYIANRAKEALGGSYVGKKVAVLGLSFKAGTSDVRKSPGIKLANILDKSGAKVRSYDPQANDEARKEMRKNVEICDSLDRAVQDTDAIFITTDWPEFKDMDLVESIKKMDGNLIIDCMNCIDTKRLTNKSNSFEYIGIGRS